MAASISELLTALDLALEVSQETQGSDVDADERLVINMAAALLGKLSVSLGAHQKALHPGVNDDADMAHGHSLRIADFWKVGLAGTPWAAQSEGMAQRSEALLAAKESVQTRSFQCIGRLSSHDRTTVAMVKALAAYRESQAGYQDVLSKRTTPKSQQANPLLAWLGSSELKTSVRAEALAHVEMYVRSGHAERDLGDSPIIGSEQEREAILALRQLTDRLGQGESLPEGTLTLAIERRFSQVFIQARVRRDLQHGDTSLTSIKLDDKQFSISKNANSTSGAVGALIRDAADPQKIWMGCTTAAKDTRHEADQLPRFAAAVKNALARKDPPFGEGGTLDQVWFFSPATFPDREDQRGHGRESLVKLAKEANAPWSQELLGSLRNLSLWKLMDSGTAQIFSDPKGWLLANHATIGGASAWQPGAWTEQQVGPVAQQLASQLSNVLGFVAHMAGYGQETIQGRARWGVHNSAGDLVGDLCAQVQQATVGFWRHFKNVPGVHETLRDALPAVEKIRAFREGIQKLDECEQWDYFTGAVNHFDAPGIRRADTGIEKIGAEAPPVDHTATQAPKTAALAPAEMETVAHAPAEDAVNRNHGQKETWLIQYEDQWSKRPQEWKAIKGSLEHLVQGCEPEVFVKLLTEVDPRAFQSLVRERFVRDDQTQEIQPFLGASATLQLSVLEAMPFYKPATPGPKGGDRERAPESKRPRVRR